MPRLPSLPRTPTDDLVADLRDDALDIADDLDGIEPEETTCGQAAQTLEEFVDALTRIRDGAPDASAIAQTALTLDAPLKPIGNAADTIKRLLKPRRE